MVTSGCLAKASDPRVGVGKQGNGSVAVSIGGPKVEAGDMNAPNPGVPVCMGIPGNEDIAPDVLGER